MKNFLRVLTYIWFSLLGMAEFVVLLGIIGATVDPAEGNEPLRPISAVVVMVITFLLLILIDLGGFVRLG